MTKIYALQTATMIGDALEGTAQWFCDFHSPHNTQRSALKCANFELDRIRDEDIARMRELYPIDQYNDGDYYTHHTETDVGVILELLRRCGTDGIPVAQMVITPSEILETT